jgi:methionyl-tRNA synthetase
MELSSYGNTYLQEAAPWKLFKDNPEDTRIADTMYNGLQIVTLLSVLCEPFVPFIAPKIRTLLGLEAAQNGDLKLLAEQLEKGAALLPSGKKIGEPTVLFPKINDRKDQSRLEIVNRQKEKLEKIMAAEKGPEREPVKAEIQFDDFVKLDFRTATIMEAEKVKKADKLLKLTLDMGLETRTVVSGIAEHYQPEAIIGQQVVVVANLASRKLRGILSQGMILMAENDEGKLVFVSPSEPFGNGFTVR